MSKHLPGLSCTDPEEKPGQDYVDRVKSGWEYREEEDVCVPDHRHTVRWAGKQNPSSQARERTAGMGES